MTLSGVVILNLLIVRVRILFPVSLKRSHLLQALYRPNIRPIPTPCAIPAHALAPSGAHNMTLTDILDSIFIRTHAVLMLASVAIGCI